MNKNGVFVREVGDKKMPYDIKRLAQITNTDIDTAMVAMKIFLETGLIMESEDGSFEVSNISGMIGSETNSAERMRIKRANIVRQESEQCSPNVRQVFAECTTNCSQEIDIEIEKEIDIDIDNNIPPLPPLPPKEDLIGNYTDNQDIKDLLNEFIGMRKKKKKPMTDRAIKMALNKLDKLSGGDDDKKISIIEQSIYHCWDDFYIVKEEVQPTITRNRVEEVAAKLRAENERKRKEQQNDYGSKNL